MFLVLLTYFVYNLQLFFFKVEGLISLKYIFMLYLILYVLKIYFNTKIKIIIAIFYWNIIGMIIAIQKFSKSDFYNTCFYNIQL